MEVWLECSIFILFPTNLSWGWFLDSPSPDNHEEGSAGSLAVLAKGVKFTATHEDLFVTSGGFPLKTRTRLLFDCDVRFVNADWLLDRPDQS